MEIMIVDDEPQVAEVLATSLKRQGHSTTVVHSGREALEIYAREPVDLVVTDLGMPGMTGLVLAAEIKRQRLVPVVLLTGWADELDASHATGVDVVLAKPFTREKLLEGIAKAVPDRVRPI